VTACALTQRSDIVLRQATPAALAPYAMAYCSLQPGLRLCRGMACLDACSAMDLMWVQLSCQRHVVE
jgi:hypothetical protein